MPTQTFALEPEGPKRLEVRFRGGYQDVTIALDGARVGVVPSRAELEEGRSFPLPDGSVLRIELARSPVDIELRLTRDGRPLPGSVSDPHERVRLAGFITLFIAVCSALSGLAAELLRVSELLRRGIGWPSVGEGLLLVPLGLLTLRASRAALVAAISIMTLEGLAFVAIRVLAGFPPPAGVLLRFVLLIPLVRGVQAIDELRRPLLSLPPKG